MAALKSNACCHSNVDEALTRKISEVGKLLDIHVIDHVIVTSEGYFSFADEGLM